MIFEYLQNFSNKNLQLTHLGFFKKGKKYDYKLSFICTIVSTHFIRLNLKETSPKELVCEVYDETEANESQLAEPKENPTQRYAKR